MSNIRLKCKVKKTGIVCWFKKKTGFSIMIMTLNLKRKYISLSVLKNNLIN